MALDLNSGLMAGGAPYMWKRAFMEILPKIRQNVPKGSRVIEVGYGDGLLTCYLCAEFGWSVTGFDIVPDFRDFARENACRFGLENNASFHCCTTDDTWQHVGEYDAVFIKTVLYNASTISEYGKWLDWILSVLKTGGVLINFESGRSNALTQAYRRVRGRSYRNSSLYTKEVERLYDARFEILYRQYYGGFSQFCAPIPWLYLLAARVEEINKRHAGNCFIVSMIARKR